VASNPISKISNTVLNPPPFLGDWFFGSANRYPDNIALVADKQEYSYSNLCNAAQNAAQELISNLPIEAHLVGLFGHRTFSSFAGLLGILASGRGYVPISHKFPPERCIQMLNSSGIEDIVVDVYFLKSLLPLLQGLDDGITIYCLSSDQPETDIQLPDQHKIIWIDHSATATGVTRQTNSMDDNAYLLYTSGSTGTPKGVSITHKNASAYVTRIIERYEFYPDDRFSQCYDLTFDLSVHDMVVCWGSGASLHILPDNALMAPIRFIIENNLTVWFSVPSTIAMCQKIRLLKPNILTSLRISLFCGEPLLIESAKAWAEAAPQSTIDNLYGPTEATIAFTGHVYDAEKSALDDKIGFVPIGKPFTGLGCALLDKDFMPVEAGGTGELYLGGDQLYPGYWNAPEMTKERFIDISVSDYPSINKWYRTGDLARYTSEQGYIWVGRTDSQIKINGYRAEISEIEHHLRKAAKSSLCVAIDWPRTATGASGIVA
jgi:amino acid adenylation domain-containing protein